MPKNEKHALIDNLLSETKKLVKPINFTDFIEKCILIKSGEWYHVPDFSRLPDYARLKIRTISNGSKGIKVKFSKYSKF